MMMPFSRSSSEMIDIAYELPEISRLQNAYNRPLVICSPNMSLPVLGPAGALLAAGLESFHKDLTGKHAACIISGSNNGITRMEEIIEWVLLYKGLKHYFIVGFPQRPGALKEFVLNVPADTDDITFFEYTKKDSPEKSSALVGIEVDEPSHFEILLET